MSTHHSVAEAHRARSHLGAGLESQPPNSAPTVGILERVGMAYFSPIPATFQGREFLISSRSSGDLNSLLTTSTLLSTDWKGQDHLQVPGFISLGDNAEHAEKMRRYRQALEQGRSGSEETWFQVFTLQLRLEDGYEWDK